MKNLLRNYLVVLLGFLSISLSAQDFQGKAIYQTKTKMDMDFSNSGIPLDRIKMIKERMKSMNEKTFELTFNKTASIYKQEAKLDQPVGGGGGMHFVSIGGPGSGKLYKNTKDKKSTKKEDFFGKIFLVKAGLKTYDWKLEQETKMIGNYLCFKATTVIEERVKNTNIQFGKRDRNEKKDKEKDEDKKKEKEAEIKMESVIVSAWYALEIPVAHGPDDYWGLPGLVLEVSSKNIQILCTKIVLNPKDKVKIEEPKKGKVVNEKEYNEIVEQKRKEMKERFGNERKKGRRGHAIRIGG